MLSAMKKFTIITCIDGNHTPSHTFQASYFKVEGESIVFYVQEGPKIEAFAAYPARLTIVKTVQQ
jgi:hypothetical protein